MWPWSKKKETEAKGEPAINIKKESVAAAIISLRTPGAHFSISYAQMNGYDEKLTNPERFPEIVSLINSEPQFTSDGIDFAVKCQMEELDYYASNPNGMNYGIPGYKSYGISKIQEKEDNNKWARELLYEIKKYGKGNLEAGLKAAGFDFRDFLVSIVVEMREEDIKAIDDKIAEKRNVLRTLFLRAYNKGRNKYGEVEYDDIYEEAADFFKEFFPEDSLKFFVLMPPLSHVVRIALTWVDEAKGSEDQPINGIDFEHWCARKIEDQGWSVVVSKASGDQGVDIIASCESITVAVQCKRYNSPIGNKAVQEAFTGARHYNADLSVVIGTGGFTRAAQEIANTTNVILLDAEMIGDFTNQVMSKV